jgi:hypothetical protein
MRDLSHKYKENLFFKNEKSKHMIKFLQHQMEKRIYSMFGTKLFRRLDKYSITRMNIDKSRVTPSISGNQLLCIFCTEEHDENDCIHQCDSRVKIHDRMLLL